MDTKKMLGFGLVVVFLVFSFVTVSASLKFPNIIRGGGFENVRYVNANTCKVDLYFNSCVWDDISLTINKINGKSVSSSVSTGSCNSGAPGYPGVGRKYYTKNVNVPCKAKTYTFYSYGTCSGDDVCEETEKKSLKIKSPCTAKTEVCDGKDNDCDGLTDEGYVDSVTSCGVGFCAASGLMQCVGGVEVNSCSAGIPSVVEICGNSIDDDCDGGVDEGCVIGTYYLDSDWDSYGDAGSFVSGFGAPFGYVDNSGDCDDSDADVNPGAIEICGDGIDNDCSGGDLSCGVPPVDDDKDGDGYNASVDDCNDLNASINPGAIEICGNGVDENCDGVDDSCGVPYDDDKDKDGYNASVDDCNDLNASINPGALELCGDGVDNNCDGFVDEGCEICSVDANCSDDYYEDRYCDGDDIYKTFHDFSCVVGDCVENVSEVFVKECRDDCRNGKCRSDDDDDDDDDYEPVNFFVGGGEIDLIDVNISEIELGTYYSSVDDVGFFWVWILLLIAGIVLLLFVIVWARMD
jgi:hypothetical protein